jgi:hypothetical protein
VYTHDGLIRVFLVSRLLLPKGRRCPCCSSYSPVVRFPVFWRRKNSTPSKENNHPQADPRSSSDLGVEAQGFREKATHLVLHFLSSFARVSAFVFVGFRTAVY